MQLVYNKKGFSITELLVVLAIVSGLMFATNAVLVSLKGETKKMEEETVARTEEEFLNKFLYQSVLGKIGLSYGILKLNDDRGKNFFDYYPDYHGHHLSTANKKRTFTMTNGKKMVFLSSNEQFKRINVLELYRYVVTALLQGVDRKATFQYAKLKSALGSHWALDKIFLFYIPIYLRKSVPVNMREFPKIPAFIAHIKSGTAGKYNKLAEGGRNHFAFANPTPGTSGSYTSFTDFLEKSNLVSGQDVLFAGAVSVFTLMMENNKLYQCLVVNGNADLACNASKGQLISDRIRSLKLIREDVSNTEIKVSFEFL